MSDDEYVALFCPHCGGHVNEDELENDHGYTKTVAAHAAPTPVWGSVYVCGWCKLTTSDWSHVVSCRARHTGRTVVGQMTRRQHEARRVDLQRLLDEVS